MNDSHKNNWVVPVNHILSMLFPSEFDNGGKVVVAPRSRYVGGRDIMIRHKSNEYLHFILCPVGKDHIQHGSKCDLPFFLFYFNSN